MKNNWLLKAYFLFCASVLSSSLFGQGLWVEKKDGTKIRILYEILERVTVYDEVAPNPEVVTPTDLSQCAASDVEALQ